MYCNKSYFFYKNSKLYTFFENSLLCDVSKFGYEFTHRIFETTCKNYGWIMWFQKFSVSIRSITDNMNKNLF